MATGLASGRDAIKEYVKCTLLCRTLDKKVAYGIMGSALHELVTEDLLRHHQDESYEATQLGQAIVASAFSPEDGLFVHEELQRSLQAFVMDGDMQVFYMFTPLQIAASVEVDWHVFREQVDCLDESGIRALQFVGVSPAFVNTMYLPSLFLWFNPTSSGVKTQLSDKRAQSGASLRESTPEEIKTSRIYRRAYTAFQLRDLSNEVPLSTISHRYRIPRGTIQTLAQQCHGFAAGIVKFCTRMNWGMFAAALDHMRDRLEAGARADLLDLARVAYVKGWTARLLRENGFRNLRALAEADPKALVPVLMLASPSSKRRSLGQVDAERYAAKVLARAEVIVSSAGRVWREFPLWLFPLVFPLLWLFPLVISLDSLPPFDFLDHLLMLHTLLVVALMLSRYRTRYAN